MPQKKVPQLSFNIDGLQIDQVYEDHEEKMLMKWISHIIPTVVFDHSDILL